MFVLLWSLVWRGRLFFASYEFCGFRPAGYLLMVDCGRRVPTRWVEISGMTVDDDQLRERLCFTAFCVCSGRHVDVEVWFFAAIRFCEFFLAGSPLTVYRGLRVFAD